MTEYLLNDVQKKEWETISARFLHPFLQARPAAEAKKETQIEVYLLLIGINEVGLPPRAYAKEEKMDLIHVGTCAILEVGGYYTFTHRDADGWPHYSLARPLPALDADSQAQFLIFHIYLYFKQILEQN